MRSKEFNTYSYFLNLYIIAASNKIPPVDCDSGLYVQQLIAINWSEEKTTNESLQKNRLFQ